jgi:hypothetical protein
MKRSITAALALAGVLAFPGVSQAADQFGSQLKHEPANGPEECDPLGPCTFVGYNHPTPPNGDNKPRPAPYDGVVVKLRARSFTHDNVQFAFANIREQGTGNQRSALASLVAVGPSVTFQGTGNVEEFPARVRVRKGAHVALNAVKHGATYNSDGGRDSYEFAGGLNGTPKNSTGDSGGELLVQAQIERDADRDGFGDETQDRCKNQAGGANGCDRVKPVLRGLKAGKRKVSYRLSERARVSLKIQRKSGRRYKKVRTLSVRGKKGRNAIRTSKRLRKLLHSGRYRVVAQARDGAGNKSAKKVVRFRVKR